MFKWICFPTTQLTFIERQITIHINPPPSQNFEYPYKCNIWFCWCVFFVFDVLFLFIYLDLPKAFVRLAKNPLYICLIAGWSFNSCLMGFYTFIPKYIEKHFNQTPAIASIVAGMCTTVSSYSNRKQKMRNFLLTSILKSMDVFGKEMRWNISLQWLHFRSYRCIWMGSGTDPGRTVPRSAVQEAARSDETRCHSQRFYPWLFFRFNALQLPETGVFRGSNNFRVCLFFKINDKILPQKQMITQKR